MELITVVRAARLTNYVEDELLKNVRPVTLLTDPLVVSRLVRDASSRSETFAPTDCHVHDLSTPGGQQYVSTKRDPSDLVERPKNKRVVQQS
ncbi:hypothetical protein P879_02314 [Paragonimus westermani]|uniref:Uncharacterized protein n=1 Tax=Paragonimus westermani TaxID=34504 RepID=A0A8T0DIB0_9TREM|nr:hypothetical protein P879_02314 [Paragonimus westermani]